MSIEATEYVFTELAAMFGAEWERARGNTPVLDWKTTWVNTLNEFTHCDEAKRSIMWALDNLPDSCPKNARAFRSLCLQAPARELKALSAPVADPARMAAELAKLGSLKIHAKDAPRSDMKDWAHRLRAKEDAGYKLSRYQASCVDTAIGARA